MRLIPALLLVSGTMTMLAFQNCGQMKPAVAKGAPAPWQGITGGVFDVSSANDFMQMTSGNTYNLTQDIVISNQNLSTLSGLTLDGHGHKVSGLTAQCANGSCQINSGRENYVSGLDFYQSTISNIEFDLTSDISLFPAVENDITAVNLVSLTSSTLSHVTIRATISGTHPYQSGDSRFDVSLLDSTGNNDSSVSDVDLHLTGDVTLPEAMQLMESPVAEIWGSTYTNVTVDSSMTYRLGANGTVASFESMESLSQSTASNLTINENVSIVANGHTFTSSADPTSYPISFTLSNSTLAQNFDFVPNTITQLADVQPFDVSHPFVVNSSTYTVTHP